MRTSRRRRGALITTLAITMAGLAAAPGSADTTGTPGDPTITVDLNDSTAGGTYEQTFVKAYDDVTEDGTPVYVYVPEGALAGPVEGVASLDPAFDPNPDDDFDPCDENLASDYVITEEQVDLLGDTLADQIVSVDEEHFGPIGEAEPGVPETEALVTLVYNVQDDSYYDCDEDTYTAGYFAPEYIEEAGMNVIVIDAFDWANRVGEADAPWRDDDPANDRDQLYEGVIAHELEHLLMYYSDAGELSWVDEGLADMAGFFNNFDIGGSHLTYHQVFHRETSLTRWGGGLENYGASFTYFLYLWEQAGGNGDGSYEPDLDYDAGTAGGQGSGDWLIKRIFAEEADGMEGVQDAIDAYNSTFATDLRSAEALFRDWALAIKYDVEGDPVVDIINVDFGDPASTPWTIDMANTTFWSGRGQYNGAMPDAKWRNHPDAAGQTALPFGTSYESFRNPGPQFDLTFSGEPTTVVAPHSAPTHWYGGYESQADNVLEVTPPDADVDSIEFWTWYFIEEGWDYGFVEVLVDGTWHSVPLEDDGGQVVTTNDDPHDNNEEGNGLTGTSGGEYFVDEPQYVHLTADLSGITGTITDVQFRYSTDAAYLDTGWFLDDIVIDGAPTTPDGGDWTSTTGEQDNSWTVQVVTTCDIGIDADPYRTFELDGVEHTVYRWTEDLSIELTGLNGDCLHRGTFEVIISNLPSGDLSFLDAEYELRVTAQGKARGRG